MEKELNVPVIFNKKIVAYSGSHPDCKEMKFIDPNLIDELMNGKPLVVISLTDNDKDENGDNIITQWVLEYKEDYHSDNTKSIKTV